MTDLGKTIPSSVPRAVLGVSCGRRAVARIASKLTAGRGALDCCAASVPPLPVGLIELTGVSDPTIVRLTLLAIEGTLTPETAARLAMRHAREIGGASRKSSLSPDCTSSREASV